MELDAKLGFDLGWEYFLFNVAVPEAAKTQAAFIQGHTEAKARVKQKPNDRFIRKHLQLRFNAWRRNRVFDPSVTPFFIKRIDVTHCPITNVMLTHSTKQDTDWSVDRIQNNAAYVPGNLVVVSTKANAAKGDKTYEDIWKLASGDPQYQDALVHSGLNMFEWRRWMLISSLCIPKTREDGSEGFTFAVAPCVVLPPMYMAMNSSVVLQQALAFKVSGENTEAYPKIVARLSPKNKVAIKDLLHYVDRTYRKAKGKSLDVWFNDTLFKRFYEFYEGISKEEATAILSITDVMDDQTVPYFEDVNWEVATGGYLDS